MFSVTTIQLVYCGMEIFIDNIGMDVTIPEKNIHIQLYQQKQAVYWISCKDFVL
jgi:hypothetical protein